MSNFSDRQPFPDNPEDALQRENEEDMILAKKKKIRKMIILFVILIGAGSYAVWFHLQEFEKERQERLQKEKWAAEAQERKLEQEKAAELRKEQAKIRKKQEAERKKKAVAEATKKAELAKVAAAEKKEREAAALKEKQQAELAKKLAEMKEEAKLKEEKRQARLTEMKFQQFRENFKGDITTKSGKVYKNCTISNVSSKGIDITYATGVKHLRLRELTPEFRAKIGYPVKKKAKVDVNVFDNVDSSKKPEKSDLKIDF
jgi:DNA polymerase III gamma/tau subunit